jgi:hypothetical protein
LFSGKLSSARLFDRPEPELSGTLIPATKRLVLKDLYKGSSSPKVSQVVEVVFSSILALQKFGFSISLLIFASLEVKRERCRSTFPPINLGISIFVPSGR